MSKDQFEALFFLALMLHFQVSSHWREPGVFKVGDAVAALVCFLYAAYAYYRAMRERKGEPRP